MRILKPFAAYAVMAALAGAASGAPWGIDSGSHNLSIGPSRPSCLGPTENGCNVIIGQGTGLQFTKGAFNLLIGADACPDFEEGDYNLCLGSGTKLPPKASHMLALPGVTKPLSDITEAEQRKLISSLMEAINGLQKNR